MDDSSSRTVVAPGVVMADGALRFTFARGSGPGGQSVNKTATATTLTVRLDDLAAVLGPQGPAVIARLRRRAGRYLAADPDRLVITDATSRSQIANRKACLVKLRGLVVEARRPPRRRKKTKPSAGARRRRLESKQQRSRLKRSRRTDRSPPRQ